MVNQTQASSKRARTDTEEARQQITAILTSLNPMCDRRGITFDLPISDSNQLAPIPLRGNRLLLRTYAAKKYAGVMPVASFNFALSEQVTRLRYEYEQAKPSQQTLFERERVQGHSNLYIVPGEGICTIRTAHKEGEEEEILTHLWDSLPVVHNKYVVPTAMSGYETQYDLQIGIDRHIISIDELKTGRWVSKFASVSGVLSSGKHGMYIDAISQIASHAPVKFGVEATGWYNIGDELKPEWVYLVHDGRYISSDGLVHASNTGKVELRKQILAENELALWTTHEITVSSTVEAHKQAGEFLTQLGSSHQALIAIGHAAIAMIYDVRNSHYGPSHSLALVGSPSTGKTAIAALARCLVYPYKRKPLSDATYEDTVTSIEFRLAARKSVPVFIDDLPERDYNTPGKKQEYIHKADSLIRATYNESAVRQRMTSKLQQQKTNVIQSLPSSTWEVVPDVGTSCLRRVLILTIQDGEIQTDSRIASEAALDQIYQHVPAINNIGYRLAVFAAKMLEKHGKEGLATKLFEKQSEYEKRIRASILERWNTHQPTETIPGEWASIAENAAYDLLGLWLLDQVALHTSTFTVSAYNSLVDAVYSNILRIAGTSVDSEGLTPVETALLQVFNTIAEGKQHNNSMWRVERYKTQPGSITPKAYRLGCTESIPIEQWQGSNYGLFKGTVDAVAYIDDQITYLTKTFRDALKAEYNQLPGVKPLTSDTSLSKLLDRSGWLVRLDSRRCTRDIDPHGCRIHGVLAIDNKRLFRLLDVERIGPLDQTQETPSVVNEAVGVLKNVEF